MSLDLPALLAGEGPVAGAGDERPPRASLPTAVLTVELQRGVIGDLAAFPELRTAVDAGDVVGNTARLLDQARAARLPVVHCTAEFRADWAGTAVNTPLHSAMHRRPDHLVAGTAATELVPGLGPAPGDLVLARRHGVSPFTGTALDATLRNLGVRVVVATGVSVNVAVLGLCIEAVNLGYQVVVPTDAVAGTPAEYAAAVLANSIGLVATLSTVDDVIAALDTAIGRYGAESSGAPSGSQARPCRR